MGKIKIIFRAIFLSAFSIFLLHKTIRADFEVCNPEKSTVIYKFTKDNCPYGVLFYHPITAVCLASTNSEGHFISDLCEPDNYTIKPKDSNGDAYKVQLAFVMDEEPIDEQNSCSGIGETFCNTTDVIEATASTLTEPGGNNCEYDDTEEQEEDGEKQVQNQDQKIFEQTERMFKYMLGLIVDYKEQDYANIRIFKLIKHCFRILSRFCDSRYVPLDFGKDALKAFMFLFRESDLTGFTDITVESYQTIKKVLDECEKQPNNLGLIGSSCKTCPNVYSIDKNGQTLRYMENDLSFTWGKHDVPVDATWGAINFVHGLCYHTYKSHVNFHHHFQQEAEKLFRKEIMYRWERPVKLKHEELWDHLFSANIKNTMRNLDACIQGAYRGTPFLHPLERLFLKQSGSSGSGDNQGSPDGGRRRKKRALPTMTLDEAGLHRAGWCFQSQEDLLMTTEAFVNANCPNNRKALEEVKEIVECNAQPHSAEDEHGSDETK